MSVRNPGHIDPNVEFGHAKEWHHRFAVIALWWLVGISLLLLGMSIGPTRQLIESVDDWWNDLMLDTEVDGLIRLCHALALLGATEVSVPLRFGVAIWLGRRAAWARLGVWVGAIVVSEATLTVLKALYGRGRPPFSLEVTSSSSFPSGHSIAATAIAIALIYVFATAGKPARHWFYVAAAYAVVMALSRTYLRVHWLSDVTIGSVIGASSVVASVWIVERFTVGISGAFKKVFGWAAKKKR